MMNADMPATEDGFPLPWYEVMRHLALNPFAEVTVDIGGILVDVCDIAYDTRRDKTALKVLPADLADAIRRITRNP